MNKTIAALIVAAISCTTASAQEAKPQIGEWYCFDPSKEDVRDVQFIGETWRVNNINLKEGGSPLMESPAVIFSSSIANRSGSTLEANIEVIGLNEAAPVFALSARPILSAIKADSSSEALGYALSEKGTLKKASRICIRAKAFAHK